MIVRIALTLAVGWATAATARAQEADASQLTSGELARERSAC